MDRVTRLESFARLGFAARGLVYVLLGYLALSATGGAAADAEEVLERIRGGALGNVLLALVGFGLASYGIYRLYEAVLDLEGDGGDAKGIAMRIGHGLSGAAHSLLALYAFRLLTGDGGEGDNSDWAAWLMAQPFGNTLLLLIGVGFLLAALSQAAEAVTAAFMRGLDSGAPNWTKPLGRAGYAARAVVFGLIGYLVADAALSGKAAQAGGISDALRALGEKPTLLAVVAAGLILFGLFSFIEARYRRINDAHVIARLKDAR